MPAVDIKDGCVVRFVQGKLQKKVYSRDPVKTARHWVKQGAEFIHVVDLDGAATGTLKNLEAVKQIAREINIPVQFGGGVRSLGLIKALLDAGVQRVVLGTKAVEDYNFLRRAFKEFKEKIIVSVDARDGKVFTKGWQNKSQAKTVDFVQKLKEAGLKQIIYTDISKDGTLKGPNIKDTKQLLKETQIKIIASGGISSLDDIYKLKMLEKYGLVGIIIGKALYEGRFTLTQALKLA